MTSGRSQRSTTASVGILSIAIAAAVLIATPDAAALEGEACRIEILVNGQPLTEYAARGTTYIEALKGREFAIRLTNLTNRRIAVALAIDGLNSIDATTTSASEAAKWVLDSRVSTTISGWQTSSTHARRFFFTTQEHSYGEWLGRTANLGVIEAVVFREQGPRGSLRQRLEGETQAPGPILDFLEDGTSTERQSDADDLAATGIGRRIEHQVRRVHLEFETQPSVHLRLRYEYRPQLVHLGILPNPEEEEALARRERATGFSDFSFAPDPFNSGR